MWCSYDWSMHNGIVHMAITRGKYCFFFLNRFNSRVQLNFAFICARERYERMWWFEKEKKNNNEHQIKSFESESRQMNYELNSAWASVLWFTLSTLTRMHFSPVNVTISLFALICHPNKSFDCSSIFIIEAIMVDLRPHLIYFVACVCLCWLWINFLLFLN